MSTEIEQSDKSLSNTQRPAEDLMERLGELQKLFPPPRELAAFAAFLNEKKSPSGGKKGLIGLLSENSQNSLSQANKDTRAIVADSLCNLQQRSDQLFTDFLKEEAAGRELEKLIASYRAQISLLKEEIGDEDISNDRSTPETKRTNNSQPSLSEQVAYLREQIKELDKRNSADDLTFRIESETTKKQREAAKEAKKEVKGTLKSIAKEWRAIFRTQVLHLWHISYLRLFQTRSAQVRIQAKNITKKTSVLETLTNKVPNPTIIHSKRSDSSTLSEPEALGLKPTLTENARLFASTARTFPLRTAAILVLMGAALIGGWQFAGSTSSSTTDTQNDAQLNAADGTVNGALENEE